MQRLLIPWILALSVLAACFGGGGTGGPAALQASDPARPLEAAAGTEFQLVIESNPSTGYHWELIEPPDPAILEFVSRDYRADEPVMPGSGGLEVWTFQALSPGSARIELGYFPPSNDPVEAQQTVTFDVIVK